MKHTRDLYQNFVHVAYGGGSVLLWLETKSQGKGTIFEVFFPNNNALYSIAFGTHTKTAEPIEMPVWDDE